MKKSKIGTPNIEGAKITATILENQKDDKIIVFKRKEGIIIVEKQVTDKNIH